MTTNVDERRGATSASNAEADYHCPGRHQAQRGLPDVPTDDSFTGTRVHLALCKQDPAGLTFEERDTYDRCREIESRKIIEFFGPEAEQVRSWREDPTNPEKSRLWVQVRMNQYVFEHSARPDVFHRVRDRALIVEYKTLAGDVPESPKNLQLRDQEVLVRGRFLITGDIGVVVVQPLVENNPPICIYTPEDSRVAQEAMFSRVIASNSPGAPRYAGEQQCKFCKAAKAHTCMEYQRFAGSMAPSMLSVLEVPVANWSPEQRAIFCDKLSLAQQWLDDVKDAMKEGLQQDPSFVPGWTLEQGNKREQIVNPQVCFERFTAVGGSLEQFMGTISVGKTKLKGAVAAVTGAKGKGLDNAIKTLTEGIVEVSQNAPSLKRAKP